jgi:Fe-S cluster assembly iron-binding protein IscA
MTPTEEDGVVLEITESAGKRMAAALAEDSQEENECFRILLTEAGVKLVRDEQQAEDVAVEHDEQVVLVMDSVTAEFLKDQKIDYDEAQSALVFT